jgi:hypothetical protein
MYSASLKKSEDLPVSAHAAQAIGKNARNAERMPALFPCPHHFIPKIRRFLFIKQGITKYMLPRE